MKKIILFCFLCALMLVGCSNAVVDEDTSAVEKEQIIQTTDEEKSDDANIVESDTNDLLYREYQSGEHFFSGVAYIAESDVLSLVSNPVKIMILYNDGLFSEIDFTNTDMTIEMPKDGNYCFLAVNEENNIIDITSIVVGEAVISEDGGVIPLN